MAPRPEGLPVKIHEYQGKDILRRYGVAVPMGRAAATLEEAEAAIKWVMDETRSEVVVVKAQIHAGGRGKGGGVKVCRGRQAALEAARAVLGMTLRTHQTGPAGKVVRRLLVEQGLDIARELYVGMVIDRQSGRAVMMASSEGGMEIEEVAATHPEKIMKEAIDPAVGLAPFQARRLAYGLALQGDAAKNAVQFFLGLAQAFQEMDGSLAEINPLVITTQGAVLALDAKMSFDDNAIFRHADVWELRDLDEEDPSEVEAKKHDLSYIKLDGNIGCMVNGAGLAMATMDIIKHYGGRPANFLDVGGGAKTEQVCAAFKIITADPSVKAILVNIFGGIMRCDTVAAGVVEAVKQVGLKVPLVVRLEGTNVEIGRKLLAESGLKITSATDMADGARRAVEQAR
jgi:succinyl-CoA synthetase beta subunit